jgi:hypothetical protein
MVFTFLVLRFEKKLIETSEEQPKNIKSIFTIFSVLNSGVKDIEIIFVISENKFLKEVQLVIFIRMHTI